jgi:hypothetical protein
MNIEEFFGLSAGKWFSHRTSQNLPVKKSEEGKADIIIETLPADHPEVVKLCQQYKIAPNSVSSSVRVTRNSTTERDKEKHSTSTVLVSVPDADNPAEGKLLRQSSKEKTAVTGRYKLGSDEALILTTEYETMSSEERLWFASPNLRMRVSIIKNPDGFSIASFTSEIRMGGSPPPAKASNTANAASS